MRVWICLFLLAACDLGDVTQDDNVVSIEANQMMKRVVIGRLYQKRDWTLRNAGTTNAERIEYVCTNLVKLRPTYVSGLIRLDDDAPLTADQIAVYTGVRACLPNAKFDVVLNAEHYTDPTRHANGREAQSALEARARELKNTLHADVVFFDYFNSPYNDEHKGWYRDALTDGTQYIRNKLHMKVGGNVWGFDPPPHADFIALDNFDRGDTNGYEFDKMQIDAFGGKYPILLHVENNPQKKDSLGLRWIDGDADYRRGQLAKYGGDQAKEGFSYMFPVFFPLQCCSAKGCGPDRCQDQPSDRISYDAVPDGNLLQKIDDGLGL